MPCPLGTYSNSEGLEAQDECEDCMSGFYCPETGEVLTVLTIFSVIHQLILKQVASYNKLLYPIETKWFD